MTDDRDVVVDGGRVLRVRTVGPPDAPTIMFFHGTPDSRLSIDMYADLSSAEPVRLVAFDRPGYGGSDFEPFTLGSVAVDAGRVLDHLGIDRCAVLSQSGGGPFALATAAQHPDRVRGVGVASGPGSFPAVAGAVDSLTASDREGLALIGVDDAAAAERFATGFAALASLPQLDDAEIVASFKAMLPPDAEIFDSPLIGAGLATAMREGLRQGVMGAAWDNVGWVGPWDVDLSLVQQPTWLWCGSLDPLVPPAHGEWLKSQLPQAELVVHDGEGHAGIFPHWWEYVARLVSTLE